MRTALMRTATAPVVLASALLIAALVAPSTANARSICTGVVPYNGNISVCHSQIRDGSRVRGLKYSQKGNSFFYWFGPNVVSARCLTQSVIALAAFHEGNNLACPLLNRVKDAIQ